MKPTHCMFCGKKMTTRYPGNNPENGPAELSCKNHGSPTEWLYEQIEEMPFGVRVGHLAMQVSEIARYERGTKMADVAVQLAKALRDPREFAVALDKEIADVVARDQEELRTQGIVRDARS